MHKRYLAAALLAFLPLAAVAAAYFPPPMVPDGSNAVPYAAQNLSPNSARLEHWRAALARVRAGTGRARLVIIGDNTAMGTGSGSGGAGRLDGAYATAWPRRLATLLGGAVPVNDNGFFTDQDESQVPAVAYSSYDPRVTLGTGWSFSGSTLGGSLIAYAPGSASTLSFSPLGPFDTFVVYYSQGFASTYGSFTVNVDGGSSLGTVNCGAGSSATLGSATFTVTKGTHTINLVANNDKEFFVWGVLPYDSTTPAVDLIQAGHYGAVVANFVGTGNAWSPQTALLNTAAPDLTLIDLTVNDSNNGTSLSSYQSNMQSLIATALTTGDVVLGTGPPSNTTAATNGTLAQYIGVLENLAVADNLPFVNLSSRWGSYANINALFPYYDTVDPEALGYWDIGLAHYEALAWP